MKGSPEDFAKWQGKPSQTALREEPPKLFKTNVRLFCIGFSVWQLVTSAFILFGKFPNLTLEQTFIVSVAFGIGVVALKGR